MSEKGGFILYNWLWFYMVWMQTSFLLFGLTVNNNILIMFITLKEDFDFCISLFHSLLLLHNHVCRLKYVRHLGC